MSSQSEKNKKELIKRLNYVKGQLGAIERMIAEEKTPGEIYTQLRSVESAFHKSILETFESRYRKELAELLVSELEGCPGECQYCDTIETVKKEFPTLAFKRILTILQTIQPKEIKSHA